MPDSFKCEISKLKRAEVRIAEVFALRLYMIYYSQRIK